MFLLLLLILERELFLVDFRKRYRKHLTMFRCSRLNHHIYLHCNYCMLQTVAHTCHVVSHVNYIIRLKRFHFWEKAVVIDTQTAADNRKSFNWLCVIGHIGHLPANSSHFASVCAFAFSSHLTNTIAIGFNVFDISHSLKHSFASLIL